MQLNLKILMRQFAADAGAFEGAIPSVGAKDRSAVVARWPLALAMAVCFGLGVAFIAQTAIVIGGHIYFSLADDVMISMTYARNLAAGHGLTWFPGDAPVEGFTNPLWTLWLALVHLVTPDDRYAPLLVALSGLAMQLTGLVAVDILSRRLGAGQAGRLFALLVAATLYAPTFWALRGFEVGVVMAIQTWMLVFALDFSRRGAGPALLLGAMAGVAFLTRMDSLVISSVIVAIRLIKFDRTALNEAAIAGGIMLAACIGLEVFRIAYFRDYLPNTAYLKLSNVPLMVRLHSGVSSVWHAVKEWTPLGALAIVALAMRFIGPNQLRSGRFALTAVLAVVGVQFAYSLYVGGDAWEWSEFPNRFISTVAYPLCAAAGVGLSLLLSVLNFSQRGAQFAAMGFSVATALWTSFGGWIDTFQGRGFQLYEEKYLIYSGVTLKNATPEDFTFALTWAGTIPYYAEGRHPVDLLGKMDPVISHIRPAKGEYKPGHNKHDLEYSIGKLHPDAMLQPPVDVSPEVDAQMAAFGYLRTPGGWWITAAGMRKLKNPAILNHPFWWEAVAPDLDGEAPPSAK